MGGISQATKNPATRVGSVVLNGIRPCGYCPIRFKLAAKDRRRPQADGYDLRKRTSFNAALTGRRRVQRAGNPTATARCWALRLNGLLGHIAPSERPFLHVSSLAVIG